ncbi:unnamed protein product [Rotaria magnacalcarata]|uniref:Uncharacterized protein n=1 Tax=Rotaria magnacalcarata TaxID=392030 RepID=A0A816YPZ4_9BILA|nr:unnamed protein product [Rotaria magnacalcarata]CAF2193741.1 unnamed protein product [Rotaria magnacalcarata]CAF3855279.1 unnamed protein product [Rotaria magnacalcarata]CAF3962269.1 unnamed protein product [Rotaria magnacalcarata]
MFHAKSPSSEVVRSLKVDLTGNTVLITGGIGLEIARALATAHAHVIITGRDMIKIENALQDLRQSTGNEQIELIELHRDSLESIRSFAEDYIKRDLPLHILICNAGGRLTRDGFELDFGVNHLGLFLGF